MIMNDEQLNYDREQAEIIADEIISALQPL